MSDSPNIVNVTAQNFAAEVLHASHTVPVLVDFWASWCQPCQLLLPVLTALAESYQGKMRLAKIDTEQEQALAMEFGIRSIPTLKIFRNGQQVDELQGAQPESVIREALDAWIVRESDIAFERAVASHQAGDLDAAIRQANEVWVADPDNPRPALGLAQWLLEAGRLHEAAEVAKRLPDQIGPTDTAGLKAQIRLAQQQDDTAQTADEATLRGRLATDPNDADAAYDLARLLIAQGQREAGLEQLLGVLRSQADFRDGAARQTYLDTLATMGADDPRVGRYRRALFTALH